jgi:predicted SAM-dependent methyltransferase
LKLNLASGLTKISDWVNIDGSPLADISVDLRRQLPLRSESAALIFCEHFCDHLSFPDGIHRFLSECHRLLEPGGRARFVLHDATGLMRACVDRDIGYFQVAEIVHPTMMESVNFLFRFEEGHQFLYDFETFQRVLVRAGFRHVEQCKYGESSIPELTLDIRHPSREVMSMYVEATK